MRFAAIFILVMTLFACNEAKKQTGYSDSKCFNSCKTNQECVVSQENNQRYNCRYMDIVDPSRQKCDYRCSPNQNCRQALDGSWQCVLY